MSIDIYQYTVKICKTYTLDIENQRIRSTINICNHNKHIQKASITSTIYSWRLIFFSQDFQGAIRRPKSAKEASSRSSAVTCGSLGPARGLKQQFTLNELPSGNFT
jgi:hypothetical protein